MSNLEYGDYIVVPHNPYTGAYVVRSKDWRMAPMGDESHTILKFNGKTVEYLFQGSYYPCTGFRKLEYIISYGMWRAHCAIRHRIWRASGKQGLEPYVPPPIEEKDL